MQTYLIDMLVCPICHGDLRWDISEHKEDRIEEAEAFCQACQVGFPIRDGIGLFLTPDLPRQDLWHGMESGLARYLREHPETERKLMDAPLASLSPADQFLRSLVLEERGALAEAREIADLAYPRLYTPEYLSCHESQYRAVIERLATCNSPIVDLASGKGHMVERLVRELDCPVVATDFSPTILRRDREQFEALGLYEQTSLLCFDARRTPFKSQSIQVLTTNLGLSNIENPGGLLKELRRIVGGIFLAIAAFYPEDDEANAAIIRQAGLADMAFKRTALARFSEAGFEATLENIRRGKASPTPVSQIIEGAAIDALPVQDTILEWCTIVAH